MFDAVLEVCPSFRPVWKAFLEDWRGLDGQPPLYVALGDLARHVVRLVGEGAPQTAAEAFGAVETWHAEGDPWVREHAVVAFLEAVQVQTAEQGVLPDDVRAVLGASSTRWWDKLDEFWLRGAPLRDE